MADDNVKNKEKRKKERIKERRREIALDHVFAKLNKNKKVILIDGDFHVNKNIQILSCPGKRRK